MRVTLDPALREDFHKDLEEVTNALNDTPFKVENRKAKLPRNAMKVVLSTPTGTNPEKARLAAASFAKAEFGNLNHRYLFSLHTDTENPHVHLVVKMKNEDGLRLETSKSQLQLWRESFAEHCRMQGIEVESSYRSERGVGKKGVKAAVYFKRLRGEKTHYDEQVKARTEAAYQSGEYVISGPELAQLRRNIEERKDFVKEARYLRVLASELGDKERQRKLVKTAQILEKEALRMPIPKSLDREILDEKAHSDTTKVKPKMPEATRQALRDGFKDIQKSLETNQNLGSSQERAVPGQDLDSDIER